MKHLFLFLSKLFSKKRFIGLFDADGEPLFEGDEYVIFVEDSQGRKVKTGSFENGNFIQKVHKVEYVIWGSNAGYPLPLTKLVKKIKE